MNGQVLIKKERKSWGKTPQKLLFINSLAWLARGERYPASVSLVSRVLTAGDLCTPSPRKKEEPSTSSLQFYHRALSSPWSFSSATEQYLPVHWYSICWFVPKRVSLVGYPPEMSPSAEALNWHWLCLNTNVNVDWVEFLSTLPLNYYSLAWQLIIL